MVVEQRWSRIGMRVISVGLLLGGLVGGTYLGRQEAVQVSSDRTELVFQADAAELRLLKERHNQHVAARAYQREAEQEAAAKAGAAAKAASGKARLLERKLIEKKAAEKRKAEAKKAGTVPFSGPIPSSCNEFSGNRKIGCALMLQTGFEISQFGCLNKLWNKESGWNHKARNPSSGAYGIPQAYPGNKMSSAGSDWQSNPATQIKWGLGYIKGRYNTPCGAWSRSESTGSY
jgi:hypothetical protein